jgi:hypothetical protein
MPTQVATTPNTADNAMALAIRCTTLRALAGDDDRTQPHRHCEHDDKDETDGSYAHAARRRQFSTNRTQQEWARKYGERDEDGGAYANNLRHRGRLDRENRAEEDELG